MTPRFRPSADVRAHVLSQFTMSQVDAQSPGTQFDDSGPAGAARPMVDVLDARDLLILESQDKAWPPGRLKTHRCVMCNH